MAPKPFGAQRPTLRDVSRLAGVSRMTVSRVIRGVEVVTPETRDRVRKAVADLGYVPDRAAGSLATRRTGFIALVLPSLTNANFAGVAHGLTDALRKADYHLLISYTGYSLAEEELQIRNLLARRPEAIVLTGAVHSRTASRLLVAAGIPVIEIADLPQQPIQHAVGFSNYEVGRSAARYLIGKGFARIGAVGSSTSGDVIDHRGEERLRGFEDELRFSGRSVDLVLRHGSAPVSFAHGAAAAAVLLARPQPPDALFAVSDLSAVGVVMHCQRAGIEVPRQLSVLGFGDFEIGSQINPALTTVHVDFKALGQRTGTLLLELLSEEVGGTPQRIDIGLHIVERDSVQAPR